MNKQEQGVCPVCNGTGGVTPDEANRPYADILYGYDAETDTLLCHNCGGQYQWGIPTGKVNLRRDNGEPCVHEHTGTKLGNCYWGYTCKHCGDYYTIDSGD